jgi:hypothetical protein
MKYLILDHLGPARNIPVIFSHPIDHLTMAQKLGGTENVLSAGFVNISIAGAVSCSGRAIMIPDKPSRPEDDRIIQRMINY